MNTTHNKRGEDCCSKCYNENTFGNCTNLNCECHKSTMQSEHHALTAKEKYWAKQPLIEEPSTSQGWEKEFDENFIYTHEGHWAVDYKGQLYRDKGLTPLLLKSFIRSVESRAREEGEAKAAEQYRGLGALTRSEAVRLRLSAAQVERERCVKIVETMTAPKNYPTAFQGGYDLALHDAIQSINKN